MHDRVQQLVTTSPRLATPPAAYFRLCQVLDDPGATGMRVAQIVRTDPSLTARVLRVSNSAAFNQKEHIDSVLHACVVLGTNRIRQMALAAAVQDVFRGIPAALMDMRSFWEHSIAVASGAEIIARHLRRDGETAFIDGLLHDIGLLVICLNLPQDALKVLKAAERSERRLHLVEHNVLGFDHSEVGAVLLESWSLPNHADVARWHNEPARAADPLSAGVVHLADIVAIQLELGWTGERVDPNEVGPACERLGISGPELDRIIDELRAQVGQMSQTFAA